MALSTHDELLMLRKRARRRLVGAIVLVSVSTAVLWNVVGRMPEQAMKPESVDITGLQAASAAKPVAPVVVAEPQASPPVTELLATLPPEEAVSRPAVAAVDATASVPAVAAKPVPQPEKPAAVVPPKPAVPKPESKPEPVKPEPAKPVAAKPEKPKAESKKPDPMAILEGREEAKTEDKPAAKPADAAQRFSVQLAALSDPSKVEALKAKLAGAGINARFSKVQTSKGEVTRVRMGPFASRAEADAALRRLAKAGVSGIVVPQ